MRTMIVTGASQGIGAGVTKAFLKRGYNVAANSLRIGESDLQSAQNLALVEGDIAAPSTAAQLAAHLSPMQAIPEVGDIVDAVVYLTEARHVTGEVLHVDAGMHNGKW